jgi:hypothetical protein
MGLPEQLYAYHFAAHEAKTAAQDVSQAEHSKALEAARPFEALAYEGLRRVAENKDIKVDIATQQNLIKQAHSDQARKKRG